MPTFYTDGSCNNHRDSRLGGCAYVRVLQNGQHLLRAFSRPFSCTSSNRMELMAVILALESLTKPSKVAIYSDSLYVIKVARFLATRDVRPTLKNKDLWHRYKYVARQHRIEFTHVRGHRGNHFNEIADVLAGRAHDLAKVTPPEEIADVVIPLVTTSRKLICET